ALGDSDLGRGAVIVLPLLLIPGSVFLFQLIAYAGYALSYSRLDRVGEADVVVVLGAGLNGNQVTPLLASRLDRGIEELDACVDAGRDATIVVSGGQGVDEVVSEAEAMQAYLVSQNVDAHRILVEDQSTTTAENLQFTVALLRTEGITWHRMAVVTSNFHVLRAASITESMGLPAAAVGSPTAPYYVPTAFLREFAATVVHFRRGTLVTIVGAILLWILFAAATGLFAPLILRRARGRQRDPGARGRAGEGGSGLAGALLEDLRPLPAAAVPHRTAQDRAGLGDLAPDQEHHVAAQIPGFDELHRFLLAAACAVRRREPVLTSPELAPGTDVAPGPVEQGGQLRAIAADRVGEQRPLQVHHQ